MEASTTVVESNTTLLSPVKDHFGSTMFEDGGRILQMCSTNWCHSHN
jgi:hypothetical protein